MIFHRLYSNNKFVFSLVWVYKSPLSRFVEWTGEEVFSAGESVMDFRLIKIFIVSVGICSCQNQPHPAPITDADPIPGWTIDRHVVAPGETLYSIALKYDVDYEKLARANRLSSDYSIRPGQTLTLHLEGVESAPEVAKKTGGVVSGRSEKQSPRSASTKRPPETSALISWHWPVSGKVLDVFSGSDGLNKGIDIRGKLGEPVRAAADGDVVYSGSGLRGYGNLIIVKHSESYLSAYAHNRVLLVREGQSVKAGQAIAEVGFSGTNVAKLHFEIRFNGKPVDPLRYLPDR